MSKFYKENNSETTKDLFNKSIAYKWRTIRPIDNNVVDFNFGEKFMYGRVRRDSTPIVCVGSPVLKTIQTSIPSEAPQALNFVVDIFEEMTFQFEKCAALGKIDKDDPFLSLLVAHRAYKSPSYLYNDYKNFVFAMLQGFFESSKINFETFDAFIMNLKDVAVGVLPAARITFPGYVKSKDCSILCSGLAIEIADEQNFSNDHNKIEKFVKSKNWNFYVNTCDTYGFMIDYNAPWRIVADIDSESMRKAAKTYGYENPEDVLSRAYYSPSPSYLAGGFLKDLHQLYNMTKTSYWIESGECESFSSVLSEGHQTIGVPKASKNYTLSELASIFSPQEILELYLFFRIEEEVPHMNIENKKKLIRDVIRMRNDRSSTPLAYFERIINKEFDKVGSYDYIKKAQIIQRERDFAEGEQDTLPVEYK